MCFCRRAFCSLFWPPSHLQQVQSVLMGIPMPLLAKTAAWLVSRNKKAPVRELAGTVTVETHVDYSASSRELLVHTPPLTPPDQAIPPLRPFNLPETPESLSGQSSFSSEQTLAEATTNLPPGPEAAGA